LRLTAFIALVLAVTIRTDGASPKDAGLELFEKKIRPVLIQHCYKCHSEDAKRPKGGILLDTKAGLLKGGDTGAGLVPGKPKESLLIRALRYESDLEMPPKGKLPDAVIADFERWIALGAPDPRHGEKPKAGEKENGPKPNWAFSPPKAHEAPAVPDASWPRGAIDRFILAKLEAKDLAPAPDADRVDLARRLWFGLTGLPPTPEEIDAFLQDSSPKAYENLVDRLLDSRHFGERWGRHWLDVARYSDSTGGGRTKALVNAWRYRDYVIEAFNSDKPYDQFIREQLAGDLLRSEDSDRRRDEIKGSGFLMLGPHNYENQDKDLLRMDVVDEQIDTTGRAFLALTLGCARCHDHKFDPLPTRDYYALAGIFRSTKSLLPGNVAGFIENELPAAGDLEAKIAENKRKVAALETELAAVKKKLPKKAKAPGEAKGTAVALTSLVGIVLDDRDAKTKGSWTKSTSVPVFLHENYIHDNGRPKGALSATFTTTLPKSGEYEVRIASPYASNRATNTPVTIEFAGGKKTIRVNQRKKQPIRKLFTSVGRFPFTTARPAKVTIETHGTDGVVIVDGVQLVSVEDLKAEKSGKKKAKPPRDSKKDAAKKAEQAELEARRKNLEERIKKLKSQAPKKQLALSVRDEAKTEDWHVHVRGETRNLGPKVPRGFLTSFTSIPSTAKIADGESGRRELADWIARADHPLTARVIVNRVWHWLFGAGLVRTVDNFGSMGEEPSHPELLDTLAVEFVRDGWSIKKLVRRIVLSRTFGLSSAPPRELADKLALADPENSLLSHMPRRRLAADELRDAILSASGSLDLHAGGPAIDTGKGKKTGNKVEYGYRFSSTRRSVYIPIFRNTLLEILEVFDFADPNLSVGRRSLTTRSTQALYLLNSPFMIEQSETAAKRLLGDKKLEPDARIVLAYRRILGRPPTTAEAELAEAFVSKGKDDAERLERWTGFVQTLFACVDFRFLR